MTDYIPDNITVIQKREHLTIYYHWLNTKQLTALGSMVGLSVTIGIVVTALIGSLTLETLITSPITYIVLALLACAGVIFMRHTVINIAPTNLIVEHKPLGYPSPITIAKNDIKQLYVKKELRKEQTDEVSYYKLCLVTQNNTHLELLKRTHKATDAQYLELCIEEFLGLEHEAVPGEHRLDNSIWSNIRDKNKQFRTLLTQFPYLKLDKTANNPKATGLYSRYQLTIETLPQMTTAITLYLPTENTIKHKDDLKLLTDRQIIQLVDSTGPDSINSLQGYAQLEDNGQKISYICTNIVTNKELLNFLFERLKALLDHYPNIINFSGAYIDVLYSISQEVYNPFQPLAMQLLDQISTHTTRRFGENPTHWLCLDCLDLYKAYKIHLTEEHHLLYYACQDCGKSHAAYKRLKPITLVLDESMQKKHLETAKELRINWFQHKKLFPYNKLKIINTTDQELERFIIQISNDTDPIRRRHYKNIPFSINPSCHLSQNSIRLLEKTFANE